jgi:uncharacterized protein (DUF302 family)
MMKIITGFFAGMVLFGVLAWQYGGAFMFNEYESPYGVEETAARIQQNIKSLSNHGWKLSALRDPGRAVNAAGSNVLPVLLVEACSTDYSAPLLKDDDTRLLSILMPCTITVYKKQDGKTYIATMNAGLMGKLFGSKVDSVMTMVAADQKVFVTFDASKPAPPLIKQRPGGSGGAGGSDDPGC